MGFGDLVNPSGIVSDLGQILGISKPDLGNATDLNQKTPYIQPIFDRKIQVVNPSKWNQVFRYFFSIEETHNDGSVSVDSIANHVLAQHGFNNNVIYFEVPPSNISISTQFAISVSATNGGILEEHNGVVFRNITISGSTGVWPKKPTRHPKPLSTFGKLLTNVFPGVTTALGALGNAVQNVVSSVIGSSPQAITVDLKSTGYYNFWMLHNFLVAYAEAKKKTKASNLRLIFGSPKDNVGYVCTPVTFDLKRDSSNALLYRYTIILKAWDLTTANGKEINVFDGVPVPDNVNAIKAITNTITDARAVIDSASNVLSAVNSDLASIMNVYTQATLVLKSAAGLAQSIGDFGAIFSNNKSILLKGQNNSLLAQINSFQASIGVPVALTGGVAALSSIDEQQSTNVPSGARSSIESAGGAVVNNAKTPGGEDKPLASAQLDQASGVLDQALKNSDFLATPLDKISVPSVVQDQIDQAVQDAQELTSGQVRDLASKLQEVSDNLAANVGMMDADYAATYGLPPPANTGKTPTEDDIILAAALQDSKLAFISTLATGQLFGDKELDPFVAANKSLQDDDQMNSPLSSLPVPFERGGTLERLAQRYLGDANRAREIAILNNLRAPYIDEVGFSVLIFDANSRQFVVNDSSNLAINQQVTLQAATVAKSKRRILDLEDIGGGQFRVTVDGPTNLSIYSPGTNPFLTARLPNTVGPGDVVLIPDDDAPDEILTQRPNPIYSTISNAEKVFKIDMALDETGRDFSISPSGDINLASGYDNAVQAIRIAIETESGELEQHPTYGLAIPVGIRSSDITLDDLSASVQQRVEADPRFTHADTNITVEGSVVRVNIAAQGAGSTGIIPVEFEVGKQ